MKVWTALLLYLLWVFGGAALLAPGLWWAAHALAGEIGTPWAGVLADHPFHRYVSRCLQGLALAGMIPFARALGCRGAADLGWRADADAWRRVRWGLGLGLATATAGMILEGALGTRTWRVDVPLSRMAGGLAGAFAAGLAVGLAEETLFRGLLLGALQRVTGPWRAWVASSLLYAALHFLERGGSPETVAWDSGWQAIGRMFAGFGAADRVMPRFVTLVAAGLALGLLFLRTGSLFGSVALHGGWVFAIKLRGIFTQSSGVPAAGNVSDWVALGTALTALAMVAVGARYHRPAAQAGPVPDRGSESGHSAGSGHRLLSQTGPQSGKHGNDSFGRD